MVFDVEGIWSLAQDNKKYYVDKYAQHPKKNHFLSYVSKFFFLLTEVTVVSAGSDRGSYANVRILTYLPKYVHSISSLVQWIVQYIQGV